MFVAVPDEEVQAFLEMTNAALSKGFDPQSPQKTDTPRFVETNTGATEV